MHPSPFITGVFTVGNCFKIEEPIANTATKYENLFPGVWKDEKTTRIILVSYNPAYTDGAWNGIVMLYPGENTFFMHPVREKAMPADQKYVLVSHSISLTLGGLKP
jgi:hypothetical protein